jgi:hypothetical protein
MKAATAEPEPAELVVMEQPVLLSVQGRPEQVLADAASAARALKSVIDGKANPVRMNGKTYLEFEDWQTVGRFYGVAVRVVQSKPILDDPVEGQKPRGNKGWEARAEVVNLATNQVISQAESMCGRDEPRWAAREEFQIRSMAQTRACAKALRNCLAWVVVLAGFGATPAEELPSTGRGPRISDKQRNRLYALVKKHGWSHDQARELLAHLTGLSDSSALGKDQYDLMCEALEAGPDAPRPPASPDREAF